MGGFAQSISTALNNFIPQVGSVLSLGHLADFVPGSYTVPQDPIAAGAGNAGLLGATAMGTYPSAY